MNDLFLQAQASKHVTQEVSDSAIGATELLPVWHTVCAGTSELEQLRMSEHHAAQCSGCDLFNSYGKSLDSN